MSLPVAFVRVGAYTCLLGSCRMHVLSGFGRRRSRESHLHMVVDSLWYRLVLDGFTDPLVIQRLGVPSRT